MREKSFTVLSAKLTAPKPGKVVSRARLLNRLDMAWDKSVIWVGAPAGSGKTTLIADYLAQRKLKPLWYRVDARDADPAAFFSYLRRAAGNLAPCKEENLPVLTPEYAMGLPVFTLNFFEQLFSRLPKPAVLVFDNYQDLVDDSPLHELLPRTIAAMPEEIKIIFISRTDLPINFAPLQAARQVSQIIAEEVILHTDEAIQLGKSLAKDISSSRIERLNRFANGWIAGLILLLEGADDAPPEKELNSSVFNYFASEVMRRADEETQDFLVKCALLPVMDAASSAALTGNGAAEAIFKDLVRRNYFINRLAGKEARYEFHPLFRDYLLNELTQQSGKAELRDLKRRAGQILISRGEHAAAINLLADAKATEDQIGLVLGRAQQLVADGKFHTLEQWLLTIPEEVRAAQPWLNYWLGTSRMPFDLVSAKDHFESAYRAFFSADDATGVYLSWIGIADCFNLMWDDYSGMAAWLDEYEQLHKKYPAHPSEQVEFRMQAALFGALVHLRPLDPDCNHTKEVIEPLLNHAGDADFRIRMLTNLFLYYTWGGSFADQHRAIQASERILDKEGASSLSHIIVKLHRATLCWVTGEPELALEVLSHALEISQQSGVHMLDSYILSQSVYAYGVQNNVEAMGIALKRIKPSLSPQRRLDEAHYYALSAWHKELSGDIKGALNDAQHSLALVEVLSVQVPLNFGRYCTAMVMVRAGQYKQADDLLQQGLEFSRKMSGKYFQFTGLMLRAFSRLEQNDKTACKADLKEALSIAATEQDFWIYLLCNHKSLSRLCAFALHHDIEADYVRALVKKWHLLPPNEMDGLESWPWPIQVHMLGRFSVAVDGKKTPLKGKTLEMLKVIIARGGRDVDYQAMGDLLWPHADGDQAQHNLKITLHRLRKVIGQQTLQLNDGKLTLDSRQIWVDVWAFGRLLTKLESSPDDQLEKLALQVSDRYHGGMLPGETTPWIQSAQNRLRNRFLRITGKASERLCGLGQWQAAIDCYQKALETDPLAERFYIGLMRCHHQLGQKAEGLAVYDRCRETLQSELDIPPSNESQQWHTLLRQGPLPEKLSLSN